MPLVDVSQLIDKTLVAKQSVNVYKDKTGKSQPHLVVPAGQIIGMCYSWVSPSSYADQYYFMIKRGGETLYVKFSDASKISFQNLAEQGVKTVQQVAEEIARSKMTFGELAISNARNIAIIAILVFAAVQFIPKLLKK